MKKNHVIERDCSHGGKPRWEPEPDAGPFAALDEAEGWVSAALERAPKDGPDVAFRVSVTYTR